MSDLSTRLAAPLQAACKQRVPAAGVPASAGSSPHSVSRLLSPVSSSPVAVQASAGLPAPHPSHPCHPWCSPSLPSTVSTSAPSCVPDFQIVPASPSSLSRVPDFQIVPASPSSHSAPSPREQSIARQKAAFVSEVWRLAASSNLSQEDAAHIAALKLDLYPDLVTGGKNGSSLIAQSHCWHNYRSWACRLGVVDGTRRPASENWKELVPQFRNNREYVRPGHSDFWTAMARIYEHPNKLSLRRAYRYAHRFASQNGVTDLPTLRQVQYHYEHHVDRKAVLIAREGEEWYRNNIADYIDRDAPAVDVCWFSDHHIFDCAIKIWDPQNGKWCSVRPWLTAWMDWGSLYFVGFQIRAIAPSRDPIERALKSAISKNAGHAPAHLYVDNGKDYRAKGLAEPFMTDADQRRVSSIAEALGCRVHFAEPYNARAKVIERIFGIVCGDFSKTFASYRGRSPEHRPESADAAWSNPEKLPDLAQFTSTFEQWLALDYNDRPSDGNILAGKTPNQARENIQRSRPRVEPLALYKAFLRELPGTRTVQRGGTVRAIGRLYRSPELWALAGTDARVTVKVDPDNIAVVYCYDKDGRELGMATSKPRLAPLTDGDPETIEQLRAEKRRQHQQIKEAKASSASRRQMSRWLTAPIAPVHTSGLLPSLPPYSSPLNPSSPVGVPASAGLPSVSPSLVSELDDALREQSRELLSASDTTLDDQDLAILREIEAETQCAVTTERNADDAEAGSRSRGMG